MNKILKLNKLKHQLINLKIKLWIKLKWLMGIIIKLIKMRMQEMGEDKHFRL